MERRADSALIDWESRICLGGVSVMDAEWRSEAADWEGDSKSSGGSVRLSGPDSARWNEEEADRTAGEEAEVEADVGEGSRDVGDRLGAVGEEAAGHSSVVMVMGRRPLARMSGDAVRLCRSFSKEMCIGAVDSAADERRGSAGERASEGDEEAAAGDGG